MNTQHLLLLSLFTLAFGCGGQDSVVRHANSPDNLIVESGRYPVEESLLHVEVKDSSGEIVPNAKLLVRQGNEPFVDILAVHGGATVAFRGGVITVVAEANGIWSKAVKVYRKDAMSPQTSITLTLENSGGSITLTGRTGALAKQDLKVKLKVFLDDDTLRLAYMSGVLVTQWEVPAGEAAVMNGIPHGDYFLKFYCQETVIATKWVTLHDDEDVEIQLSSQLLSSEVGFVEGVVLDEDGHGRSGASVWLTIADPIQRWDGVRSMDSRFGIPDAYTDATGRFVAGPLVPKEYGLAISSDWGYPFLSQTSLTVQAGTVVELEPIVVEQDPWDDMEWW